MEKDVGAKLHGIRVRDARLNHHGSITTNGSLDMSATTELANNDYGLPAGLTSSEAGRLTGCRFKSFPDSRKAG